ncbi:MAG: hypothetical protein IJS47_03655 [Clostridia bacterium]|nr:hypothetical protein [Clostridia bacterium]
MKIKKEVKEYLIIMCGVLAAVFALFKTIWWASMVASKGIDDTFDGNIFRF